MKKQKINFNIIDTDIGTVFEGGVGKLYLYEDNGYSQEKPLVICDTVFEIECNFSKKGTISLVVTDVLLRTEILELYQKNTTFSLITTLPLYKTRILNGEAIPGEVAEKEGAMVIMLKKAKINSIGSFNAKVSSNMLFSFEIKPVRQAKKKDSTIDILHEKQVACFEYQSLINRLNNNKQK